MKGNIHITTEEREALRNAIIEKYILLTGKKEYDYKLNSNPSNYNGLVQSIKEQTELSLESNKPMINFFWGWKEEVKTFRKLFIEKLYEYAYNMGRKDFLKINPNPKAQAINKNISGFWECYYDEDNSFSVECTLKRFAIFIPETVATSNIFNFYVFGMGSNLNCLLEVCSSNIVFSFRNFKFRIEGEPAHINVSFGQDLSRFHFHPENGVGLMSFFSEYGTPTTCLCLMKYFPERNLDDFNSLNELPDLVLQDDKMLSEDYRGIKRFFLSKNRKNFISTHIHLF